MSRSNWPDTSARPDGARSRRRGCSPSRPSADIEALGLFRITFTVDDLNTRRPFGQMTAKDCRYAASAYQRRGNQALMMAAFLEAVAKRIKRRTVERALTKQQIRHILVSLGGNGDELSHAA